MVNIYISATGSKFMIDLDRFVRWDQ